MSGQLLQLPKTLCMCPVAAVAEVQRVPATILEIPVTPGTAATTVTAKDTIHQATGVAE